MLVMCDISIMNLLLWVRLLVYNRHMLQRYSFLLGYIEKDRSYVETECYKKLRITTRNIINLLTTQT